MGVVPKKLSFQLRFRNKTKTRKILSRDFRLQGLLKKDSNNSNHFNYSFVKKEKQQFLLKNPLMVTPLKIRSQRVKHTGVVKKAGFNKNLKGNRLYLGSPETHRSGRASIIKEKVQRLLFTPVTTTTEVNNKLKVRGEKSHSYLIRPNKYLYIYKKKNFFRPSWFLTNRIKINNNHHVNLKKVESSNLQLTEGGAEYKSQKCLTTGWLSNKNRLLNNVFRADYVFLKKKKTVTSRLRANKLLFGRYGVCFKRYSIISSKCAETAKLDIAKNLRKKGRFWIRICCDTPISARPAETRMGKGKGSIGYWAAKVNPGQLFFEFSGVSPVQLKEIYQTLCKKSAVGLKIVY